MKRLRLLGGIVFVVSLLWTAGIIFSAPKTEAATLNVVAGTDAIEENGQCQLSEAIQNINNYPTQPNDDCIAGDGINDTIALPSGTITLSADLPIIEKTMTINGASIDSTVLSGNLGQYQMFAKTDDTPEASFTLTNLKITQWNETLLETGSGDITLRNLEVDGLLSNVGDGGAFIIGSRAPAANTQVTIENIYIHDITANSGYIHILNTWNQTGNMEIDVRNVTISNIVNTLGGINTMALGVGVMTGAAEGTFSGSLKNITIKDIDAESTATAIGLFTNGGLGDAHSTLNVENSTISHIRSNPGFFGSIAALTAVSSEGDGQESTANLIAQNVIVHDALEDSVNTNCGIQDVSSLFGQSGIGVPSISSLGGNISDDTSCSSYFTDPTDQNNVDPADLMLGTLSNNGGSVPTIPLLPGSIAIDSGTTVAGLTTDARGTTRPQCSAYDSGAYEYNGTCPVVDNNDTTALTYPDPITSSTVTLELPSDVTNGTVSAIGPTTIPKDTFFSYPLGLTSFQFDTTIGATKTITLYYDLPGDPSSYTARKYNTNTKTFSTITNATITRVTYNNKSMLRLTYDITDGGTLDQDNTANGTIIDPVGLAAAIVGVPETGL